MAKPSKNKHIAKDLGQDRVDRVIESRLSDGRLIKAARVINQTPLDRYLSRNQITKAQFDAGETLYRVWYAAGKTQRVCQNYNQKTGRGLHDSESRAKAEESLRKALIACGPIFASVSVAVCVYGEPASDWATARGKRSDAGIEYLRDALDCLKRFFRLT